MIFDALCDFLTVAVNKALVFEPQNLEHLEQLEGKWILVDLEDLEVGLVFGFIEKKVKIQVGNQPAQVDATIRGRSVDLFMMGLAMQQNKASNQSQKIHIEGDIACGMALRELLQKVHVPLDRISAHYLGEGPAYWLGALKRGVVHIGKDIGEHIEAQGIEFVRDELGSCVTGIEIQAFCDRVDLCRDQLARIEKKYGRLPLQAE